MLNSDELKILWVSAELDPYSKVSGVGDVSRGLPKALYDSGIDIRIMVPRYKFINPEEHGFIRVFKGKFPFIQGEIIVWEGKLTNHDLTIYFVEHEIFKDEKKVCLDIEKTNVEKTGMKFLFLSRLSVETKKMVGWTPNIIHANDWHTATIPAFVKAFPPCKKNKVGTILTIHNLAYQGRIPVHLLEKIGLPHIYFGDLIENDTVKLLRIGIKWADKITTVSPTYAKEILYTDLGFGLQNDLIKRKNDLVGILNGIDTEEWDPETDENIPQNFSKKDLSGKQVCKRTLQKTYNLKQDPNMFTLGMIARISKQKGFDLLIEALPDLSKEKIQIVILGEGDQKIKEEIRNAANDYSDTLSVKFGYDFRLARIIYAGTDAFLIPSKFEPCGLTQMYAMRYGSIPIAHKTGGLADTVLDTGEFKTGFLFEKYDKDSFVNAIIEAYNVYSLNKEKWEHIVKVAMSQDHSWKRRVNEWKTLYNEILINIRKKEFEKISPEKTSNNDSIDIREFFK